MENFSGTVYTSLSIFLQTAQDSPDLLACSERHRVASPSHGTDAVFAGASRRSRSPLRFHESGQHRRRRPAQGDQECFLGRRPACRYQNPAAFPLRQHHAADLHLLRQEGHACHRGEVEQLPQGHSRSGRHHHRRGDRLGRVEQRIHLLRRELQVGQSAAVRAAGADPRHRRSFRCACAQFSLH